MEPVFKPAVTVLLRLPAPSDAPAVHFFASSSKSGRIFPMEEITRPVSSALMIATPHVDSSDE
jgi:hypothetical protein